MSQFGPKELSEAMKTLSLAGLDAKQVYSAVADTVNFAVAGDTGIQKAADVMTTVATAFNITSDNFAMVGDAIAKAAAESKSSVEGMGEAFKTASVIHQQYGVSLEDTAVGLSLLANAGIQNTAAGTAMRNMYADLAGRTPKVQAALDQLGVQTIDPLTGKMRGLTEIFQDFTVALEKRTPTAQFKFIQDIFSERGGKEAIAVINAMRRSAEELGVGVGNMFDQLRDKVMDSAGFTARAAAEMSLTPLNQLKSVATGLQTTLAEVFSSLENDTLVFAKSMQDVFASEEFKSTLRELAKLIATITLAIVDNGREILTLAATYAAMRGAVGVLSAVSAGVAALGATTVAATTSIGMATRAATLMNPLLALLTSLVMAGAGAWLAYKLNTDAAKQAGDDFTNHSSALLERLQQEETRLERVNEARARGISLMELEMEASVQKTRATEPEALVRARQNLATFDATPARKPFRQRLPFESEESYRAAIGPDPKDERRRLVEEVNKAEHQHLETLVKIENTLDRIKALNKAAADDVNNISRINDARISSGVLGLPQYGKKGDGKDDTPSSIGRDNTLSTLDAVMRRRESALRNGFSNETKLLETKHRGDLISEGEYQAAALQQTETFEQKSRQLILQHMSDLKRARDEREKDLRSHLKGEALSRELENLNNDYKRYSQNAQTELDKVTNDSMQRQIETAVKLEIETKKLSKSNEDYWSKVEAGAQKEAALAETRRATLHLTEEERVVMEARTRVGESHAQHIDKLQQEYTAAAATLAEFKKELGEEDWSTEATLKFLAMSGNVDALAAALENSRVRLQALQDQAGKSALKDLHTKQATEMGNAFGDALATGVLDGGKAGAAKLKDWLKSYFIREPITIFFRGVMRDLMGGGFGGGGGGGFGGFGSADFNNLFSRFTGGGSGNLMGPPVPVAGGDLMGPPAPSSGGFNLGSLGGIGSLFGGASAVPMNPFTFGGSMASSLSASGGLIGGFGTNMGNISSALGAGNFAGALGGALPYIGMVANLAQGKVGAALGTAIGSIGGPIGAMIGGMIGGLLDGAFKGEKRAGANYGFSFDGSTAFNPRRGTTVAANGVGATFLEGPSGGRLDDAGQSAAVNTTVEGINATLKLLGSQATLTGFHAGLETSDKGRGGVFAGGSLSTGRTFGESGTGGNYQGTLYESTSTQSPDAETAMRNFQEDLKQSTLQALQAADVPGLLGDYLRQLGDVEMLHGAQLEKALERINKALTEKQQLEDTWFNMTHDAKAQLERDRKREIDGLDESNRAIALRIHALQDEITANEEAQKQQAALALAFQQASDLIASVRASSAEFINRLNTSPDGLLTPEQQAFHARETFDAMFERAKTGDADAAGSITQHADTLIQAQKAFSASGSATAATIAYVKDKLTQLPTIMSDELKLKASVEEGNAKVVLTLEQMIAKAEANSAAEIAAIMAAKPTLGAPVTTAPPPVTTAPAPVMNGNVLEYADGSKLFAGYDSGQVVGGFAEGGEHPGGFRIVGERSWELEATGASRIYNPHQIGQMLATGDSQVAQKLDRVIQLLESGVVINAEGARRITEALTEVAANTSEGADAAKQAARNNRKSGVIA